MARIATIGFFDGVHKGHCFLFEHLQSIAAQRGLQALIVTFDTHPRAVLQRGYTPQLLTTTEERKALLQAFGEVLVLPFAAVQPLTAAQFMQRLQTDYDVSVLLMGYDHQFGSDRLQAPEQYRQIGRQYGIEVLTLGELNGAAHVSSTEIRNALKQGDLARADTLLGRPYSLTGTVMHGNGIGRTIGFPTANIQPDSSEKIIPCNGVYEVQIAEPGSPLAHQAICNIGTNPTVGNTTRTIEVYIPHFDGDLYGRTLTLSFVRFIREEQKFESLVALQQQISEDLSALTRYTLIR